MNEIKVFGTSVKLQMNEIKIFDDMSSYLLIKICVYSYIIHIVIDQYMMCQIEKVIEC